MTDINSYDSAAAPSTSQTNDIQNSICEKSVKRTHCYSSSNATFSHSRNNSEISNLAYDYIENVVDEQIRLAYFDATHQFHTFEKHPYSIKSPASQYWISYILKKLTMPRALTFMIICWSISSLLKYALFSDGPLPIREAPVPTAFFTNTSGVLQDYYQGERAEKSMGQCKRIYRLYSYPVIFAYVMGGIPIVFNHPVTTDRLFSWVSHLLNPTRKLQTINDFYSFFDLYDYAVVGYFPFNEPATSRPFKVFLASAYKAAAMRGLVGFASIQNAKLANLVGFSESNELRFYSSHGNDDPLRSFTSLPIAKATKSLDVIKWIQENIGELAYRTVEHLNLEATVVLFTDYYAIPYFSHSHVMLRQLANDFHNCTPLDHSDNIGYAKEERHVTKTYFNVAKQACAMQHPRNTDVSNCCSDLIRSHYCANKLSSTSTNKVTTSNTSSCLSVEKVLNKELFHRKCCIYHRQRGKVDKFAITLPWNLKMACQYLRLLRKTQPSSLLRQIDVAFSTLNKRAEIISNPFLAISNASSVWRGLACNTNQTIGFLVLDKRFAQYFVHSWNGPQHSLETKDALAIVSNPSERIHWLDKEINKKNVESFLLDFIQTKIRDEYEYNMPSINEIQSDARNISISETLLTQLYFSQEEHGRMGQAKYWHMFCTQRKDISINSTISSSFSDASKRHLPWEYTFDTLPTVVFFPAYRPTESSAFPRNLPLTVPNLMAFILSRAQPELRWRLAITACTPECLRKNMQQMDLFIQQLDDDIRLMRRLLRRFTTPPRIHLRTLLRRRYLQRRCAVHLEKMLNLFEQARHINTVKKISEEMFINDTMFMKWLLSNRFGLTYTS
ncbi:thioredoxin domain-containing protein 11 [Ditylenchus destructor]|uniref:Thioredoxin domain-containing protein 11 n=1 Tax=Ditylenchus destructor TaxID=166010 RepID=A0AAD4NE77_9BILA|nr:thioredoxin domain-containing protein 11 [Ditylenchus destructor]